MAKIPMTNDGMVVPTVGVVDDGVLAERADHAQGQREHEGDQERLDAELGAIGKALADDLDDRPVADEARSEVEPDRIAQIEGELLPHRLVDAVEVIEPLDGRLR